MSRLYLCYRQQDAEIANEIAHRWRIKNGPYSVVTDPLKNKPDELSLGMHIETMMLHVKHIWIVVGPHWAGIDEFGRYRLSTADVPIHEEIAQALNSNRPVRMILVKGVDALPSPDVIPEVFKGIYAAEQTLVRQPDDLDLLLERPTIIDWLRYILQSFQIVSNPER